MSIPRRPEPAMTLLAITLLVTVVLTAATLILAGRRRPRRPPLRPRGT
jgi:hypothetical protein